MKNERILIVEDDLGWCEMIREMLESEGYQVQTATSYEDALMVLRDSIFQLVIVDLRLVDADESNRQGLRLLQHIATFSPCARSVVLTALPEHKRQAYQTYYGVFDYILKQEFDESSFLRIVQNAILEALECEAGRKPRPIYRDYV